MQVIAWEIRIIVNNFELFVDKACILSDFFRISVNIGV